MTEQERNTLLSQEFPPSVNGMARPAQSVPSDFPYKDEFPQLITNDPARAVIFNLIIRQMLSNDKALKALLDNLSNDKANKDTTLAGYGITDAYTKTMVNNLLSDYAAAGHSHDERYYTESEIDTKLSGKANSSHGNHVPTTQTADNAKFLRNDNTWQTVTPANIGAAAANHTHSGYLTSLPTHSHDDRYYTESEIDTKLNGKANSSHGNHVPTTQTANNAVFLRNDNTWQTVTPANIGAAASNHSHSNYLTGITKAMVTNALGYTPPQQDTNTTYSAATGSALGLVKIGSNISNSSGTISLTKANVTSALGYTPPTQDTTYSVATTSANGLMSSSDKTKLNGIAAGANAYSLPTASSSTKGGVKIGSGLSMNGEVLSVSNGTVTTTSYNASTGAWYRVYSDGWVEQGGKISTGTLGAGSAMSITLHKPMASTDYFGIGLTSKDGNYGTLTKKYTSTATVVDFTQYNGGSNVMKFSEYAGWWFVCGKGA